MLDHAAAVVRPGGRLIYATCSSEPEENDSVADAFLAAHPEFAPGRVPFDGKPADRVDASGRLVTLPFRDGLDAFFTAIFVRRQGA
jgi:16S rRNA (cytosine967-C5)-methyltransferase